VPLERLPAYTASADIGVQPIENSCLNHFTTDSNKLFEYLMAGLPVVASEVPEISRVLKRFNAGLLVPPGDGSALKSAIAKLVDNYELRKQLSANARKASEALNWDVQEEEFIDFYRCVAES